MNYNLLMITLFFYPIASAMDPNVGSAYDIIAPALEKLAWHVQNTQNNSPTQTLENIATDKPTGLDRLNDFKVLESCGFPKNVNGYTPVIKKLIIIGIEEYEFEKEEKTKQEAAQLATRFHGLVNSQKK